MRMMLMIVSVEQRPGSTEHVKTYLPNVIFSILHGKVRFISKLWMIQSRFLDELPRSPNGSCFRNLIFFFMTKSPNIRWTLGMNGFFLGKTEEKWWSSPWKMADVRQKYGRKRPFCCWEKPGLPALSSRWAPGCGTEMRTTVVAGRHWGFWTCFNQWKWWI